MIEVGVPTLSTVLEPSTAASATTEFAGFLDRTALGATLIAYWGCGCRRPCFCGHKVKQDMHAQLQSICNIVIFKISQTTIPAVVIAIIAAVETAVRDGAAGPLTLRVALASVVAIHTWEKCCA